MRTCQRVRIEGSVYFFTVNLAQRRGNDLLVRRIDALREAMRTTLVELHLKLTHVQIPCLLVL